MVSLQAQAMHRVYENFRGRLIVPHQTEGVRWMLGRELCDGVKGGIVADEMGLGKTATALAVCIGNPLRDPTLIVVPKCLVEQWSNECMRFTGIRPMIVRHKDIKKLRPDDFGMQRFILTSYSTFSDGFDASLFSKTHFGRIIIDEAHAIKNHKTKRNLYASMLRGEIKWCLSGTPVTRRKSDFRTLMRFIGVESTDYAMLREKYVMRRTFEDASKVCERLRLPPLRLRIHAIPFQTKEEVGLYRALAEEAELRIGALESGIRSEDNRMHNVFEIITRLRQATVHPKLVFEGRKYDETWNGGSTKLSELLRLVSEQPNDSKTLIFTHWNTEAVAVIDALETNLGIKVLRLHGGMNQEARNATVRAFNSDPTVNALVAHIDVGGVGLNLQAATHVYINSLDWSAASELQAIARAHRLGVNHVVHATRLVIRGTIDEFLLGLQGDKLGFASDVLGDERIRTKLDSPGAGKLTQIKAFLEHNLE